MANYYLTNQAVEDLTQIWNYTVKRWSEKQADKYYRIILETCKEVAKNPDLGKNYEGVTANLSGFKISSHIIFYRVVNKKEVEITRVLHSRMDLKSRFQED